jgi:hypothetical protein
MWLGHNWNLSLETSFTWYLGAFFLGSKTQDTRHYIDWWGVLVFKFWQPNAINSTHTHTHKSQNKCLLQFGSGSVVEEAMGVWHLRSNGCKAIYGFPFKVANYCEVGCLSVSEARRGSRFKCNISLLASSINRSCSYALRWGSIAWCAEVGRGCDCFRGLLEAAGKSFKKLHLSVIAPP